MGDAWISIGAVTSVNPARRVIRVEPVRGHAHELDELQRIHVRWPNGELKMCRVADSKATDQDYLVTLAPGVTRDTVAAMRGAELVIQASELTTRAEAAYSLEQLTGMRVVDEDGRDIGVVREAFTTPAHAIIEIETADGHTMLLPLIEEAIIGVEVAAALIRVGDIAPFAAVQDLPRSETTEEGDER